MSGKVRWGGAWVTVAVVIAAIIAAGGPGGGGTPTPTPTPTATATATPTPTATPGTTTANIWVAVGGATGAGCGDSATLVAYNAATDCTWDAANDTCEGGDIVGIIGGSYGNVNLTGSHARASTCRFVVADGESVAVTQLNDGEITGGDTGADWISVEGNSACSYGGGACSLTIREFDADQTSHVALFGVDVDAGGEAFANTTQPFHVLDTQGSFSLTSSRVHNGWNSNALMYLGGDGPWTFTYDDVYDSLNDTDGAIHDECIYATSVAHMTMDGVRIWSCVAESLFITGDSPATDWLIENSVIESSLGPNDHSLIFRCCPSPDDGNTPSPDGFTIKSSTITNILMDVSVNNPTVNGFVVEGSYLRGGVPCDLAHTTVRYNVTPTGTDNCGGTGDASFSLASINAGFVSPVEFSDRPETTPAAPGDWHLKAGSPLLAIGNASFATASDRDGVTRGSPPDIGAYERP